MPPVTTPASAPPSRFSARYGRRTALLMGSILASACTAAPDRIAAPDAPATVAAAAERPFVFTELDFPGARQTLPSGINAGGQIVGWYQDQARVLHGFVYSDGEFRSVDYPGARTTHLRGIGPGGDMSGTYNMAGERNFDLHGFVLTAAGDFINVDYPGHVSTIAQRILADGTIVGCYHDNDTMASMRGAVLNGDVHDSLPVVGSMHNGATPNGKQIVGRYFNMAVNRWNSYILDDGVFNSFEVAGSDYTEAWDISPTGTVVGFYGNATSDHGFVLEHGALSTLDYPGVFWTEPTGINAGGTIVGRYFAGGLAHGFIARRGPAE